MSLAAVILAAGQGTRMKSNVPKVLHPVAGKPMIAYAVDAVRALGSERTVVVIGHGADRVRAAIGDTVMYAEQAEQRGTGHAVLQARELLSGRADTVLVTYGDMPLLRTETLKQLAERHAAANPTITMLTVRADDPMGFGRILRDADGRVVGIVEASVATPEQLAIRELNCGVYAFASDWLWEHLPRLAPNGDKQEYFLTDLIALAVAEDCRIEAITLQDVSEVVGINTRAHLATAEKLMRERINHALMEAGVTLIDPATTYIEAEVVIGMDTVVEPNTHITGPTRIGANCRIGPNSMVHAAQIAERCHIIASMVRECTLEENVRVGPFGNLRSGTYVERNARIGNHTEVKNSRLGQGVHVGHFSYIGDSDVGARTNIGAGTVTMNYDGEKKNRTVIGEDAFIGCDTLLRAPVKVGARATTGAGSVITKDVPPDTVAVGCPARIIRKKG